MYIYREIYIYIYIYIMNTYNCYYFPSDPFCQLPLLLKPLQRFAKPFAEPFEKPVAKLFSQNVFQSCAAWIFVRIAPPHMKHINRYDIDDLTIQYDDMDDMLPTICICLYMSLYVYIFIYIYSYICLLIYIFIQIYLLIYLLPAKGGLPDEN